MSPVTHLLLGWTVANTTRLNRRERALVTLAGVIPDVDGLGMVADFLTRYSDKPLEWWGRFHHVLAHNLGFALVATGVAFFLSVRRRVAAALVFLSFHLHLLGIWPVREGRKAILGPSRTCRPSPVHGSSLGKDIGRSMPGPTS